MMKKCYAQCSNGGLKYTNGVSTKMMQSKIITTNGKHKIPYNTSKTNTINIIILSADYRANMSLLLCLKYSGYIRYFEPLKNIKLTEMLNFIIDNMLTTEQRDRVFERFIPDVFVPPIPKYEFGKKYYVVTRTITNTSGESISYFIYKNYTEYDRFIPTYEYVFDFSDPTNTITVNNKQIYFGDSFAFSIKKDLKEYTNTVYRDKENHTVTLKIPFEFEHSRLFIYNKDTKYINERYTFGGNSLEYIPIDLKSVRESNPVKKCPGAEDTETYIVPFNPPKYKIPYENRNPIVCLAQSNILTAIPYRGLNLYINNIDDRTTMLFYSNSIYAMFNATYYMYIPQMYEVAFLNKYQETNFNISSVEGREFTSTERNIDSLSDTEIDGSYNFYYGYIKITVNGLFNPISMYTYRYGYIGGYKRIIYDDRCANLVTEFKKNIADINLLNY